MINKIPGKDEYFTPAAEATAELKVKGSKFIARVIPSNSKEDADEKYADIKKKYYNATHNCFAYRINADIFRYSDDGEPSGTAGKPIFRVLESAELNETLCVITRYFGGTKLGTGGLIRAYSEAAKLAVSNTKYKIKVSTKSLHLSFSYELENLVRKLLNEFGGRIAESEYSDHIIMSVEIPKSKQNLFEIKLTELSNSTIQIVVEE